MPRMTSKELVAASARPLVLSILARGESWGYAILRDVEAHSGGKLAWSEGMLYPVLHRLEREGLLLARWRTGDSGRRRKVYRLSAKGRRALDSERAAWLDVHDTLARLWDGGDPCPSPT